MRRLELRDKRAEVGAQHLPVLRERKQTAKGSGVKGVFERDCFWGEFPCTSEGDISISSLMHWRIIMESHPCGEARELVGPKKLLWCGGKRWCMERLSLIFTD